MRRILMISYYFPPQGGIASIRALKFATYFPAFGWEPVVVAPRKGAYYEDLGLSLGATRVYRTGNLQLGRIAKGFSHVAKAPSAKSRRNSALGHIQHAVRGWLYRPDGQIGWYPFAVAAGHRAIREGRFDAIFSSSPPITAHLVARRLQRETSAPWIAEFRDLWTAWGGASPNRQRLDEGTERSILTEATEVVTVSPGCADFLRSRGARRVSIVTNGFDPSDFAEWTPRNGLIVTYLGSYYPDRQDLGTALRALGGLFSDGVLPGLRVRFVGNMPAGLDVPIAQSGLGDVVECTGFVPHKEGLRYVCESTLLLLAGPVSIQTKAMRGIVPAKAFEYLGSGRPVLFVGDPNSDAAELLRIFQRVKIVAPGDVENARAAVLSLLRGSAPASPGSLEHFTSRSVSGRLAEILDRAAR
jgi:glycosyltransferase involved in cell wall biosynthesis